MSIIKPKKALLIICIGAIAGILSPVLTHADSVNAWGGDSGKIDAGKAAAQRAAIAKREAKKQKAAEERKAAEEKKAAETQNEKQEPK